jgi:hypothetical protein
MPYIVTATTPAKVDYDMERAEREYVSRRAVATLDEARALVAEHYERATGKPCPACFELRADGGTAGLAFSDGTTITARRVAYYDLWHVTPWGARRGAYFDTDGADNIADFNEWCAAGEAKR